MTAHNCISPGTSALVDKWRSEAKRHREAETEAADRGDEEAFLHGVEADRLEKCAAELAGVAQKYVGRYELAEFLCEILALESFDSISHNKYMRDAKAILEFLADSNAPAQTGQEPVGWFYHNDYHGYQQVAKVFEGEEGQIPLYADAAQTATREALEEINALISNGDRPTVNERNAFEHFTTLNRLLLNIRDIARRALSSSSASLQHQGGK